MSGEVLAAIWIATAGGHERTRPAVGSVIAMVFEEGRARHEEESRGGEIGGREAMFATYYRNSDS